MNLGLDKKEVELLKKECEAEGLPFMLVEDEDEDDDFLEPGDYTEFQFVGKYKGQEVIYNAAMFTLALHHNSLVFEEAEAKIKKLYKDYVPVEDRTEKTKINEEAELMLEELIEEMEDEETIKVSEFMEIDDNFEYGIGLEICLNVEEIDDEVIEKFVNEFNAGTFELDKTLYSFKNEEDEDEE